VQSSKINSQSESLMNDNFGQLRKLAATISPSHLQIMIITKRENAPSAAGAKLKSAAAQLKLIDPHIKQQEIGINFIRVFDWRASDKQY